MICAFRQRTVLKNCEEKERDNTAYALTTSGEFALTGMRAMRTMLKLRIIIERTNT